jgi:hypothetical protein
MHPGTLTAEAAVIYRTGNSAAKRELAIFPLHAQRLSVNPTTDGQFKDFGASCRRENEDNY